MKKSAHALFEAEQTIKLYFIVGLSFQFFFCKKGTLALCFEREFLCRGGSRSSSCFSIIFFPFGLLRHVCVVYKRQKAFHLPERVGPYDDTRRRSKNLALGVICCSKRGVAAFV